MPRDGDDVQEKVPEIADYSHLPIGLNFVSVTPWRGIFARIHEANKLDDQLKEYRQAVVDGISKLHGVRINERRESSTALYTRNGLLWVPDAFHIELLQEVHDLPSSSHPGINRTVDLIRRHYYRPGHVAKVRQYVRNCHHCQRSKAPRDSTNGLLVPLPSPEQPWQDIAMDLITGLPMSEGFKAICMIIDRLFKERHHVTCHSGDEGAPSNETVWILVWNIYRLHSLPSSIT